MLEHILEAENEFKNNVLPWLEKNGKRIGKEASDGNKDAQQIINAYSLLHRRFEQAALGILCAAISNYKQKEKNVTAS